MATSTWSTATTWANSMPKNSAIYQQYTAPLRGVYSMPAYFNSTVYYAAVGDPLKAFPIATPSRHAARSKRNFVSISRRNALVSANGTSNGICGPFRTPRRRAARLRRRQPSRNFTALTRPPTAATTLATATSSSPRYLNGKVFVGTPAASPSLACCRSFFDRVIFANPRAPPQLVRVVCRRVTRAQEAVKL